MRQRRYKWLLSNIKAVSAQGREVRGTVEAATRRQALSELSKQGLVPLSLKEDQEPAEEAAAARELYAFTQQIANLLSGTSLTEALEVFASTAAGFWSLLWLTF